MWGKAARTVVGATIVGGLISAGAFVGAGIAGASSTVVNDSATQSDSGAIGQRVAVKGAAVAGLVKEAVAAAKQSEPLGGTLSFGMDPNGAAKRVTAISSIPVDTVANAATTTVSGPSIAAATVRALKADGEKNKSLGWNSNEVSDSYAQIQKKISGATGFTVTAANYVSPAQKQADQQKVQDQAAERRAATQSTTFGTTGSGMTLGTTGRQAPRDYGNIPAAKPGQFAPSPAQKYGPGQGIPGYAPSFGKLPAAPGQPNAQDPVQNAGQAQALQGPQTPVNVGLPMLLAVLAIAGVTAALVRTWVLRRSATA